MTKAEVTNLEISFPSQKEQNETGFTPTLIKGIYDNLTAGMTLTDCAKLFRIPPFKVNKWYKNNYCGFQGLVDQAQVQDKQRYVFNLANAKDPLKVKASMWMLERKHKEEYSKETIHTVKNVLVDQTAEVFFEAVQLYIKDPDIVSQIIRYTADRLNHIKINEIEGDSAKLLAEEVEPQKEEINDRSKDKENNS